MQQIITKSSVCALYVFEVLKKEYLWARIGKIFKTLFEDKGCRFLLCEVLLNQGHKLQTRDHYTKFGDIFEESIKQKIQSVQHYAFNSRNRFTWKPVLQKGTFSRCILFIRKLSKHDHVIYGAAKVQTSRKTN